ncbi:MAG: hypothetical protein HKM04_02455 [Legionellales bacterium]|nr:hypothetical protein [Legionellales bacterium]
MMHTDQVNIDAALMRQLLGSQFPHWADLPLQVIRPEGTDNAMYKLGSESGKTSAFADIAKRAIDEVIEEYNFEGNHGKFT